MAHKNRYQNTIDIKDFFSIGILILIGLLLVNNLEQSMDVLLWDEAIYLDRSFLLWKIIPNTWGPIYSVWYKLLSYIELDKINLYYLNYKIQSISSAVLIFIMLRRYSIVLFIAFFLAISWLFHTYNLPSWPKISHFTVQLILLAAIVSSYFSSSLIKSIIFCIAFLCCAYARPELYISFLICLMIVIIFIVKEIKHINKFKIFSLFALLLCIFVTYKFYKTPFNGNDSQRSFGVLIQHLAYNINTWNNLDLLWWYEWKKIVSQYFTEPFNLKEIVFNSNGIFIKHLLYNTKIFFISFFDIIINLFFPYHLSSSKTIYFLLMLVICCWLFIKNFKLKITIFKKNKFVLLMFLIACAPSIFSSIYAFPRTHYLILLIPLIWFLVALLLNNYNYKFLYTLIFAAFVLISMPNAKNYNYFDMFGTNKNLQNKKIIQLFKQLYLQDSISVFDAEGMLPTLMPSNFTTYNIKPLIAEDTFTFTKAMQIKQPDIIVVSETMMRWSKIKNDTLFQQLIAKPKNFGYVKKRLENKNSIYWLEKRDDE